MPEKSGNLRKWLREQTGVAESQLQIEPLAGDASLRRYFRLSDIGFLNKIAKDYEKKSVDC